MTSNSSRRPGEHPDVVCLVRTNCAPGRRSGCGATSSAQQPPYRTDRGALFVSFVANAECACHLALGWPLPANVLDLSPAFRNLTNGRSTPEGKGLLGALRYFGLDAIGTKQKDAMQKRIMQGWPFTPEEQRADFGLLRAATSTRCAVCCRAYCRQRLISASRCTTANLPPCLALMEHHGVPIDMEMFPQLADKETWRAVRDAMVPAIDAKYGVYVRDAAGDWTFNMERFAAYLAREGIDWPLLESGKLNMQRKTFEEMSKGLAAARGAAAAAAHARQDAQGEACGRRRRPEPNGAVAVQSQDITHTTESVAMDFLTGGVAALTDQTGAGDGRRIHRLFRHGISDRGVAVRSALRADQQHARHVSDRRSVPKFCQARRCGAEHGHQEVARGSARQIQGHAAGDAIWHVERYPGRSARRLNIRGARDAQPASRTIRAILALVG